MGPFWDVMQKPLVIPKWSGTTLKAFILGSPVPMNTFTEELQNEPILDPCLYFNSQWCLFVTNGAMLGGAAKATGDTKMEWYHLKSIQFGIASAN